MDTSDLAFIGNHFRETNVDPRAIDWCAERLDPASSNDSHFILMQNEKRRGRPQNPPNLTLGEMIDKKFRELGGYDGKKVLNRVLNYFSKRGISRSTGRRAWKQYVETRRKKWLQLLDQFFKADPRWFLSSWKNITK
jgi:hypothetical protein